MFAKVKKEMSMKKLFLVFAVLVVGCNEHNVRGTDVAEEQVSELTLICTTVGGSFANGYVKRCENKEVVCYTGDKTLSCKFKEQ
jgi:hypothetical protein